MTALADAVATLLWCVPLLTIVLPAILGALAAIAGVASRGEPGPFLGNAGHGVEAGR